MHGILDNIELRYVGAALAADSSIDSNSNRIDMSGYESVAFFTTMTDSAITGVATLTIEENSVDSDTGMTAVAGTAATATSTANDDLNGLVLATELYKPVARYVQAVRASETANIAYGEVYALLKPLRRPTTNHSTMSDRNFTSN